MTVILRLVSIMLVLAGLAGVARADDRTPQQIAWEAAIKAALQGPRDVTFSDEAVLRLPEGMAFIPVAQASELMRSWGNSVGGEFQGLVVPTSQDMWVVTIDQVKEGFVKDEEAKDWNADELLQTLKEGTEAQNEVREKMGIPALDVVGWVQPPAYDASLHRLMWSLKATERGAADGADATVNYNTYALGRGGYFELNLITDTAHVEADKPMVHKLLTGFLYNPGRRYEDFVPSTDHVAEYGIAALVAGVAAKKLGLLAVIGVFFAKFAKVIVIGGAVLVGGVLKLFRRSAPPAA